MDFKLRRAWVLVVALCLVLALGVAACGSSGGGSTEAATSAEAEPAETETETEPAESEAEPEASSETSGSELLAGLSTPSGSKLLDEKSSNGVIYQHYSTSTSPKEVESHYKEELKSAGWSIVSSGGSSGGWGSYGGSDYGLTAKREEDYFDLEAGGEDNSTSYFEICAGSGTREACEDLSEEFKTSSGGSESGEESESSDSGGS